MMYQSSADMMALVHQIGEHLKTVVPKYQRLVSIDLPHPKQFQIWLKTFLTVNARFRSGDKRHTSKEFGQIAELAQWLVNLHAATNGTTPTALTFHEEAMIVRDRILG